MAPGSFPPCPGSSMTRGGGGDLAPLVVPPFEFAEGRGPEPWCCAAIASCSAGGSRKVPNTDVPAVKRRSNRRRVTGRTDCMPALLTYWMRFHSLYIDYAELRAPRYHPLAVADSLRHGRGAPATSGTAA